MLAAVNRRVSATPSTRPRRVSSLPSTLSMFMSQTLARSGQFNKAFLPVISGETQALVKRQRPGMVQGAGVDGQPRNRLQPGIDACVIEKEKAQTLADRFRHQPEIGDVAVSGFAEIQLRH